MGLILYDELKKRDNDIKGYFITSNKINKDAIDVFFDKGIQYDQFIYKPILLDSIVKIIKKEHNHLDFNRLIRKFFYLLYFIVIYRMF